jgi:hypothetical protein
VDCEWEATVSYRTRVTGLALGLTATGALLAAGLAGCGGSARATAGATPGSAPSGSQALQAYVSCLNQHGVKITLPSGRPTAFPSRLRPSGPRPSGRPTARPTARPSGGFRGGGGFGGGGFGGGAAGGGLGGLFGGNGQAPAGVDQATWQAAQQACESVRPSFGGGRGQVDGGAYTAYLNCLHDHGMTSSAGPGRLNTADPAMAGALKTCAPLRPTGGPNPAGSPTG